MQLYCSPFLDIIIKGEKMIVLNIRELLDKSQKSTYWLVKKLGSDYRFVNKLLDNETTAISFAMMEKLCEIFNCEPKDLFKVQ